ncbi:hypothetical protein HK096_001434, partial [Nowakowskiella sp. JEL0078]
SMALPARGNSIRELLKNIKHDLGSPEIDSEIRFQVLQDQIQAYRESWTMKGPYLCVSHCYADKLSRVLDTFVDEIRSMTALPVWFDKEYIGDSPQEKQGAFETMINIYRNAEAVFVILPGHTLQDAFCRSFWLQRGWTLQEGVVANKLLLWLTDANEVFDFDVNAEAIEQNLSVVEAAGERQSLMLWSFLKARQHWKQSRSMKAPFSLFTALRLLSQRKFQYSGDIAVAASSMEQSVKISLDYCVSPTIRNTRREFPIKGGLTEAVDWLLSSTLDMELPEFDFCILRSSRVSGGPVCWAGGISGAIIGPQVRWLPSVVTKEGAKVTEPSIIWRLYRTINHTISTADPTRLSQIVSSLENENEIGSCFEQIFGMVFPKPRKDGQTVAELIKTWVGSMPLPLRISIYESANSSRMIVLTDVKSDTTDECATAMNCDDPLQVYMMHGSHINPSGVGFVLRCENPDTRKGLFVTGFTNLHEGDCELISSTYKSVAVDFTIDSLKNFSSSRNKVYTHQLEMFKRILQRANPVNMLISKPPSVLSTKNFFCFVISSLILNAKLTIAQSKMTGLDGVTSCSVATTNCNNGIPLWNWWCAVRLGGCNALLAVHICSNAMGASSTVRGAGFGSEFKFGDMIRIMLNTVTMTGGWRQATDTIIKARRHVLFFDGLRYELNKLAAYETIAIRQRTVSWHVEAENNDWRDFPSDSFYAGVTDRDAGILVCVRTRETSDGDGWRAMFANAEINSPNTRYWMHRTAGELLVGSYLRNDPAPGRQPMGAARRTTMNLQECQRLYMEISLPSLSVESVVDVYNCVPVLAVVGLLCWTMGFSRIAGLLIHASGMVLLVAIWRLKTYEWAGHPGRVIVTSATYQPEAAAYRITGDSTGWKQRRDTITRVLGSILYDPNTGNPIAVPEKGIVIETQTGRTDKDAATGDPLTFFAEPELLWIQKLCPNRPSLTEHWQLPRQVAMKRWRPGDLLLKRESGPTGSGVWDDIFDADLHQAYEASDLWVTARPAHLLIRNTLSGILLCGFGTIVMMLPMNWHGLHLVKWVDFIAVLSLAVVGMYRSWKNYADLGYMEVEHLRPEANTNNWYMKFT